MRLAIPHFNFDMRAILLLAALTLFAWASTGCANLSAEQNKSDSDFAVHVLKADTPEELNAPHVIPPAPLVERDRIIGDLRATAGSATPAAATHMEEAHAWWNTHRKPDMSEHLVIARERFWTEAEKTAHEAVR